LALYRKHLTKGQVINSVAFSILVRLGYLQILYSSRLHFQTPLCKPYSLQRKIVQTSVMHRHMHGLVTIALEIDEATRTKRARRRPKRKTFTDFSRSF
jgi:hypothetical protein